MSLAEQFRKRKEQAAGGNTTTGSTPGSGNKPGKKPLKPRGTKEGGNTTNKKDRENKFANLLKELQSQLALFNDRLTVLEQRPAPTSPAPANIDLPRDSILDLVELAERIYHISIPVRKRDKQTGQMKVTDTYTKSGEMVKLCTRVREALGKPITYPWQKQPEA